MSRIIIYISIYVYRYYVYLLYIYTAPFPCHIITIGVPAWTTSFRCFSSLRSLTGTFSRSHKGPDSLACSTSSASWRSSLTRFLRCPCSFVQTSEISPDLHVHDIFAFRFASISSFHLFLVEPQWFQAKSRPTWRRTSSLR